MHDPATEESRADLSDAATARYASAGTTITNRCCLPKPIASCSVAARRSRRKPLIAAPQSSARNQPRSSTHTQEPYGISCGSTATIRFFGSALVRVAVSPSSNLPYAALRGVYFVTVKRRPQDLVPTEGACSVARRIFSWLRASAESTPLDRVTDLRHSRSPCVVSPRRRDDASSFAPQTTALASVTYSVPLSRRVARRSLRQSWPSVSSVRGSTTTAVSQSAFMAGGQVQDACRERSLTGKQPAARPGLTDAVAERAAPGRPAA